MNLNGDNQFGNYQLQDPYGDMRKKTELLREAPISGAPMSGRALQAPNRAQRQSQRRFASASRQAAAPPMVQPQQPAPTGPAPVLMQSIAQIPGASPLVQSLFGG